MLTKIRVFKDKNSIIHIKGSINFYNINYIKEKCFYFLNEINKIYIDLKNLKNDDSSIILLIVSIIRFSKNKKIQFLNFSTALKKLMKSYKLEYIFLKYSEN
jgi:anti-anti-sigma regulatory factor